MSLQNSKEQDLKFEQHLELGQNVAINTNVVLKEKIRDTVGFMSAMIVKVVLKA